jgi:hypothetical protein
MKTLSSDTDPEAERVQIALLRQAGSARRFALARSLSRTTMQLARRTIRRRHPDASEEELGLIFVATYYGPELANRMRADLARRRRL